MNTSLAPLVLETLDAWDVDPDAAVLQSVCWRAVEQTEQG